MDRWLQENSTLKVLAVVLALLLWLQVASERSRPEIQRVFENMPVSWRHLGDEVAVLDIDPSSVNIVVRAERSIMDHLSRHDFDVGVNLRGSGVGTTLLYVTVSVPTGIQLVEVIPDVVAVNLEETVERTHEPRLRVEGEPAAGYEVGSTVTHPAEVTVRGGRTAVERVSRVEGVLDVSDGDEPITRQVTIRAFDEGGIPVPDVVVIPSEVMVEADLAEVHLEVSLPVAADVVGTPAPGFRVAEVIPDPERVTIEGWLPDLTGVEEVATEPIDVEGLSSSKTFRVSLILPDNTYSTLEEQVSVRVVIERVP